MTFNFDKKTSFSYFLKQAELLFGKGNTEKNVFEYLKANYPNLEYNTSSILPFLSQNFDQIKGQEILRDVIFQKVKSIFIEKTNYNLSKNYSNFKTILSSDINHSNIFNSNQLLNQKNKKDLFNKINLASQIDTSGRYLVCIILRLKSFTINGCDDVSFEYSPIYFLLQETEIISVQKNVWNMYSDKNEFISDIFNTINSFKSQLGNDIYVLNMFIPKEIVDRLPPSLSLAA